MAFDADIPLGKQTHYSFDYDASLLFAIPRSQSREVFDTAVHFNGIDRWTAYELSWLNRQGLPQVAIAEFDFSANSNNLVESKSFKLYLNSLNQSAFDDKAAVEAVLARDLSACSGAPVAVRLYAVDAYCGATLADDFLLLDSLAVDCQHYLPEPQLLRLAEPAAKGRKRYKSFIFRSLCPVTSQPDWASIYIDCDGPQLHSESLLQYLVSYRNHQGFHEQCVEMIYQDIFALAPFTHLQVYARFLRRGGLDINPLRVSSDNLPAEALLAVRDRRQ